jgi:hypothetical protein
MFTAGDERQTGTVRPPTTVQHKTKTLTPLVVNYAVGGTAENGLDYASLPGTVEIPAGKKAGVILLVDRARGQQGRETASFRNTLNVITYSFLLSSTL